MRLLNKQRSRLPSVFGELLNALAPVESIALNEAELIAVARECYRNRRLPSLPDAASQKIAELHETRKRAKLARYLVESAPEAFVESHRLAGRFAEMQQAGGEWHDWLILAEVAAAELGDSAMLPQRFAAHANRALSVFRRRLRYKI